MASLLIEHFGVPATTRDARAQGATADRVGDVLAGRTVWCATALPGARRPARELGVRMAGAGPDVAADALQVSVDEALVHLANRLDGMLSGSRPAGAGLGPADEDLYAQAAGGTENLVGDGVGPDDVVVAHDPLSAILALAVRERGAHAVWRFQVPGSAQPPARQALDFLQRFTAGIDAYVLSWTERDARGDVVERVAAAMPSARVVAAKEIPNRLTDEAPRRLAWRSAIAEVVRGDREESVGGTVHARPTVAAR